jgi:hypothetical protein
MLKIEIESLTSLDLFCGFLAGGIGDVVQRSMDVVFSLFSISDMKPCRMKEDIYTQTPQAALGGCEALSGRAAYEGQFAYALSCANARIACNGSKMM